MSGTTTTSASRLVTVPDLILQRCEELFYVSKRDIMSPSRFGFLIPARYAVCKALHMRGWSFGRIGRLIGRNHTSVSDAVRKADIMMAADPNYAAKIEALAAVQVPRWNGVS